MSKTCNAQHPGGVAVCTRPRRHTGPHAGVGPLDRPARLTQWANPPRPRRRLLPGFRTTEARTEHR